MVNKDFNDNTGKGAFFSDNAAEMEAKARELAAAATIVARGMPSPPGLLQLSSTSMPGQRTFNDFTAMSTRPLALRNQS